MLVVSIIISHYKPCNINRSVNKSGDSGFSSSQKGKSAPEESSFPEALDRARLVGAGASALIGGSAADKKGTSP